MYKVKLDYFKRSGKWYSDGEYETEKSELFEIWEEVGEMAEKKRLPGLMEGHSDFVVLVSVPDHPHDHPHLVIEGDNLWIY
jgi:hypothetical protein